MRPDACAPPIFVVLPVHNRREVTRRAVECLLAQTDQCYRLVLVDDGSTDGTADMVQTLVPDLVVLRGTGDWWWAGSLEKAYRWLRAEVSSPDALVLIANDDVTFEADFLAAGRRALSAHPGAMLLAQLHDQATGEFLEAGVRIDWRRLTFEPVKDVRDANCFSTRCLLMRLPDLLRTGGFHPRRLPHYLSDYAFTIRAQRRGLTLASDSSFRIWLDQQTTGHRGVAAGTLWQALRTTISRKSAGNPLTMTRFILELCPWRAKPAALYRAWRQFFHQLRARRR